MGKRIGKNTIQFDTPIYVESFYSIVGKKEGNGNFTNYFDEILDNDMMGEKTFEHAEQRLLESAIMGVVNKSKTKLDKIDLLLCGDLLNQIITSSFTARKLELPYVGLYGACSTMAESLGVASSLIETGCFNKIICSTSSHFSSAERQYRFPLELGNQRPPTSQWTVTGAGATLITTKKTKIRITKALFGKVTDFGIKDVNNMGAAMAPAAMRTLTSFFDDTNTKPDDYDLIITGDLGKLGSEILMDLMEHKGYKLGTNYSDCGQMYYNHNQKVYQGGSGAGCCATVLNSYIFKKIEDGQYKKVIFTATGALLSTLSSQQGDSIPGICHLVLFEREN